MHSSCSWLAKKLVDETDVGKCTARHDRIVATARAVGVEVFGQDSANNHRESRRGEAKRKEPKQKAQLKQTPSTLAFAPLMFAYPFSVRNFAAVDVRAMLPAGEI